MNTVFGILAGLGGVSLALGLAALARGSDRRSVLRLCLPGLVLLGAHGVQDRDVLLLAGLALAGLALLCAGVWRGPEPGARRRDQAQDRDLSEP